MLINHAMLFLASCNTSTCWCLVWCTMYRLAFLSCKGIKNPLCNMYLSACYIRDALWGGCCMVLTNTLDVILLLNELKYYRDFLKQSRVYLPEKSTRIFEKPEERKDKMLSVYKWMWSLLFKAREFDVLRISLLPWLSRATMLRKLF